MKLVFIGADHEVTGSCHYMEVADKKFCIDIGMEQGKDIFENQEIPVNPSEIDFILKIQYGYSAKLMTTTK